MRALRRFALTTALAASIVAPTAFTPALADPAEAPSTEPELVSYELDEAVRSEPVDFQTIEVEDSELPKGVKVVSLKGEKGKRSYFKSYEEVTTSDHKTKSVPVEYSVVTQQPVDEIVLVGTNANNVVEGVSDKTKKLEREKAAAQAREEEEREAARAREASEQSVEDESTQSDEAPAPRSEAQETTAPVSDEAPAGRMTTPAENRAYAQSVLSPSEFRCADELVNRESGWRTDAENQSSGAYGVPQSLPASKLASAGADWRTNGKTQFKWMRGYVKDRYQNSFCVALSHSHSVGWY